jgi:hypothetical protein
MHGDNDAWFRWVTLMVPQFVILLGLYMNRRPVKALEKRVEDVQEMMIRHLESHSERRR